MAGWGSGPWGSLPWGGGAAAASVTTADGVAEINIFARDLLEVLFDGPIKNSAVLQQLDTYQVTPFDDSVEVSVLGVLAGNEPLTDRVYLVVSPLTTGGVYNLSVVNPVTNSAGQNLTGTLTRRLVSRRTKIDSLCSTRPPIYARRTTSVLRSLLNAIGREDDRIGGSQDEGEEIFR